MKSLSLYSISEELAPLEDALEDAGGEVTDGNKALIQRLEELQLLTQSKVDAYGGYYKSLEALSNGIKDEEARLAERRKAVENKMKRLKDAAKQSMELRGIVKIEGKAFTVSLQKNGGKPPMVLRVAEDRVPEKWFRVKRELARDMIKDAILRGDEEAKSIGFLLEPEMSVRIR